MTASIRASVGASHARIHGVGGYRPERVVPNSELVERINSSDEWIRSRSGIVSRRWANKSETIAEMSIAAAGKALAQAGITPDQLDCVIVSTVTHMRQTPGVAPEIAHRLGAGDAAAFDISAACAGFCYGVAMAGDLVRGGSAEYVLVIGVERLSDLTDLDDRTTAFLFGDGAGAVVVGPATEPGLGPVVWSSRGGDADMIKQNLTWSDWREQVHQDPETPWPTLRMEGQAVFRWATFEMAKVAQRALDAAGIGAADLDAFIPHQANDRITTTMIKALRLPAHVPVARDIVETGNTSAASIPLAMERMLQAGEAPSGGLALVIGFGAGLVYAAQVVRMP